MTLQMSVAMRNGRLDAVETVLGTSPIMKIYTGAPPSDCAQARTGSVLATFNLPSDWMAAASGGAKAKSGTWQDAAADASGYAGYFTIFASDGTTVHMQGKIFMSTTNAPNWAGSTAYSTGQKVTNGTRVYKCTTGGTSASSGGPTGTGTSITDGSVTWTYLCEAVGDLELDNADIGVNQAVTVNTFTINEGNA